MKRIILTLILSTIIINSAIAEMPYSDINHGFWAYKQIETLLDEGIISGEEGSKFRPSDYITRAEFAVMVIKALGQENLQIDTMYTFEDVSVNHWAYKSILRALNLDILKPAKDGYFIRMII